jgi:hypothetical protein
MKTDNEIEFKRRLDALSRRVYALEKLMEDGSLDIKQAESFFTEEEIARSKEWT